MKYLVESVSQEEYLKYSQDSYEYGQYLSNYEDYRQELYREMKESYWGEHGEELTWAQFERMSTDKSDDTDLPLYPKGEEKIFRSKKSAEEFAFMKKLEGYNIRIFCSLGKDDDGDEEWDEL
jgi:hypothetical protein